MYMFFIYLSRYGGTLALSPSFSMAECDTESNALETSMKQTTMGFNLRLWSSTMFLISKRFSAIPSRRRKAFCLGSCYISISNGLANILCNNLVILGETVIGR